MPRRAIDSAAFALCDQKYSRRFIFECIRHRFCGIVVCAPLRVGLDAQVGCAWRLSVGSEGTCEHFDWL